MIAVGPDGTISIGDGFENQGAGKIRLVKFEDSKALAKEGNGLYKIMDNEVEPLLADNLRITQGALERSNVNSVEEMTNMITAIRAFEAYQKIIQSNLPAQFIVKNRFQLNESLYKVLNTERWAVYLVLTFILIIAICNIIGSVTMLIIDKQKDIAVLRTLGATKNQIQKIYFYEGMMISLLGTFIGLFLGAGFAVLQAKFKLISIYSSTGAYLQAYPVKLIYTDFLLVFATVFIIAFIANWFSAKQSSNASNNIRWAIAAN